ncbi:hypothetical protein POTOM_012835 [Populus tomentosa]|uniref:Xylanase inhibitor C-terminal domain-containing protein n=1 Tax=Populus tomentosa TaxID=118781 RepID=A0A8X8A5L8_POPTO|nr:hypothetical protein POTOM_012835 [Populus tomentosa]
MQAKPSSASYVNLLGINVNGVKLNISKTDLAIEEDGGGGCVKDCGALAPTLLVKPIFDTLHTAMADHLSSNQNLKRRIIHKDLCCEELSDDGRKNLPVATSHFEMLNLKPSSCFQTKQEFVYDTKARVLSFGLEDLKNYRMMAARTFLVLLSISRMLAGLDVNPEAVFMFREFEDCEKNG